MSKKSEKLQAKEYLLESVKPGDTIYLVCRNVARSGMSRTISMLLIAPTATNPAFPISISQVHYNTATLLGWRYSRTHGGVIVSGGGMDMGMHLVDCLSHALDFTGAKALKYRWL